MGQKLKVVIASGGDEKYAASRDAFFRAFPNAQIEFVIVSAPSGIDEQPTGTEVTLTGAFNGIKFAMTKIPDADFWVGIENEIVPFIYDENEHWFDVGCVIVHRKDGKEGISISTGVEFPAEMVKLAKEIGFNTTTVGSIIAQLYNCNPKDPQFFLTGGLVSRIEMLKMAVLTALGELFRK